MLKRIVVLLLFVQFSFGQVKEGIELCFEYKRAVSAFTSDKEANEALDKILSVIGASKNFTLIPCDNIFNALAVTYKGERYILYDGEFMKKISELTNDWSSTFILAHEVGHHINGHTRDFLLASILDDNSLAKQRQEELEADEFAGFILAKLGAPYQKIIEPINLVSSNENDDFSTHPNKDKRVEAITKGFNKAANSITKSNKNNNQYVEPKVIVNSNWTYISRNKEQIYKNREIDLSSIDPFDKKKLSVLVPERERFINAIGQSFDGTKKITLNIKIEDFQNEYGLPGNPNLVHSYDWQHEGYDEIDTRWDKYPQILETYKKYNVDQNWFELYFTDYEETPLIYFAWSGETRKLKNAFEEDLILLYDEDWKRCGGQSPYNSKLKVEYIIDNHSGYFWMDVPHYKFPKGKNYQFPVPLEKLKIRFSSTPNSVFYEDIIRKTNFINQLKTGKTLSIRITELHNSCEYNSRALLSNQEFRFKKTTYIFDLTSSSKALTF